MQRRYGDDVVIRIDGFEGGRIPPKEQIASIKVIKSSFDAEFHEIGQTVVNIQTKSGGTKFAGFLDFGYGNSLFNARNAFAKERLPAQRSSVLGYFIFPSIKKRTSLTMNFFATDTFRAESFVPQVSGEQPNNS